MAPKQNMDTMSIMIAMGMALVAVSTGLAVAGYKGRPDTVGIDLGTTFSVIALRTGNTTDVLRDEANRALVPSAVSRVGGDDATSDGAG